MMDLPRTEMNEIAAAQQKRFSEIQNVDPLNFNLTKNYYMLRLLETRKNKLKLLQVVNYFRAVQRMLSFDLKEFVTREKAVGHQEDVIEPHYGKKADGIPIARSAKQSGPGEIFRTHVKRKMDSQSNTKEERQNPVTIKAYKYNGLWDPEATSTCPLIPKHHRTYGRPSLYETMAKEVDRKTHPLHAQREMESLAIKRDRIVVDQALEEIQVINEFGQKIIYSESLNDLVELEEELIKIGSFYINQHEYFQANNDIEREVYASDSKPNAPAVPNEERPSSMIDRAEIACDLFQKEFRFQFAKVKLIEQLLETYEHTFDPLESVRILQHIVDTMAVRPRLNMEATFYTEAYEGEIELLENKHMFFKEMIDLQKSVEEEENMQVFKFQQMKTLRVTEAVREDWKLDEVYGKVPRDGSDQKTEDHGEGTEEFADKMRTKLLAEQ